MNKAFVKEADTPDADEDDLAAPALPVGSKNYLTPAGYARLDAEFNQLWKVERPNLVETIAWAASNGDRSENGDYIYGKKRLREVDRRIRFLSKRLESASMKPMPGAAASPGFRRWRAPCLRRAKATPSACRPRTGGARWKSSRCATKPLTDKT
ncbi:MAG: GreA/GreB family elongation factor [Proteobacteria bacterium]|nr:GreA/GreB family elongation factor [Pseudomonadota bacterium]